MGAALPLVRRESFDTFQDPLRFSLGPIAGIGRARGLIRAIRRRHAARVAARDRDGTVAANSAEIWIRRREQLLIEDELTGVSISGRAARITAASAAVGVGITFLEAGARARRRAIRRSSPCSFFLVC